MYQGLIGSDRWSLELTRPEMVAFCRLALQLADTMAAMAAELMPEERLCCELEAEGLWLEAEGFAEAYELHVIVQQGRQGEGFWSTAAVPDLLLAVRSLGLS